MIGISRRAFIAATSAFAGTLALPGLARARKSQKSRHRLQAEVDGGTLPPVAERLPANPLVITPLTGPASRAATGTTRWSAAGRCRCWCATRATSRWCASPRTGPGITPNVAESYEVNDDATESTPSRCARGRSGRTGIPTPPRTSGSGTRTSSEPGYRDPPAHAWWTAGGEMGRLEIVDEQMFKVHFAAPNGFFVQQLAWADQDQMSRTPAHYLKQFHIKYNPDADAIATERGHGQLGAALPVRVRRAPGQRVLPERQAADAHGLDVHHRAGRRHRARARRAQPLLLQGRYRGHAAAVFRPRGLPDGRRSRGAAAEDAAGRDRHDGPVHRHPGQPPGALRRPGGRRLQVLHAQGDRGERHGLPAQPQPPRPGAQRALQHPRLPRGDVDRRRPAGADRHGVRRPGHARPGRRSSRATRSTTSGWQSSTPSTTPTRPMRCSTRWCRRRTPRATGSMPTGGG